MAPEQHGQGQRLTLSDVRRVTAAVACEEDPTLEVLGATRAAGAADSSEVILALRGCREEPCRMVVRVDRCATESDLRPFVRERIRTYLKSSRAGRRR